MQIIARFQYDNFFSPLECEPCAPFKEQHKLILLLIAPEPVRRRVAPRYDPFNAKIFTLRYDLNKLFREGTGYLFKYVFHSCEAKKNFQYTVLYY